ncbi:MAG: PepSY-like domain-containing protein [Bacteroidia bacterium]|nr:PepSY-like domain-containing protein [Bacteroidia bacterium]
MTHKPKFLAPLLPIPFFLLLASACSMLPGSLSPDSSPNKIITYLADSLGIDSCLTGVPIQATDLPDSAKSYLQVNHASDTVTSVLAFSVVGDTSYQVILNTGDILLFDAKGGLIVAGNPAQLGDDSDARKFIKKFLKQQFPGIDLDDLDDVDIHTYPGGSITLKVEFDDDAGLVFDLSGNSICYALYCDDDCDDDGYDDDDDDDGYKSCVKKDSLPAGVDSVLLAMYQNYKIEEIVCDSLCDGTQGFWIELDAKSGASPDDVYLFFTSTGSLLIESVEIDDKDLPAAVKSGFKTTYPNGDYDDDAYRWTYANGSIQYVITLDDDDDDDDLLASFADDGTFLCEWQSNHDD